MLIVESTALVFKLWYNDDNCMETFFSGTRRTFCYQLFAGYIEEITDGELIRTDSPNGELFMPSVAA